MKKILCVFLVLVMLVALASCGTKIPTADTPTDGFPVGTVITPADSPVEDYGTIWIYDTRL